MHIETMPIDELKPADYNPRKKSEHVLKSIKQSLQESGWLAPIIVNVNPDRNNVIIGGHRRLDAARELGFTEVPVIKLNLPIEKEKALNLRLNAQEEFEHRGLASLIAEIHEFDPSVAATLGFSSEQITRLLFEHRYNHSSETAGKLKQHFLIPPFSVLDARQGYWQERKNLWRELLGNFGETRQGVLSKGDTNLLMRGMNYGTSFFDPVLAEVMYLWFMPDHGVILDPFAGEQTKAFVAAIKGHEYHGIEIRPDQVETNQKALAASGLSAHFYTGDSQNLNQLIPQDLQADLIFTSPPYYDLEVYSEDSEDMSAKQTYQEFMQGYRNIFAQAVSHLKQNRFVVLKIGEIRDRQGVYRNFVSDTISVMQELGLKFYNEAIYVQMLGTATHRAERNMRKRKVVKTHQNVMAFYQGDPELLKNPRLLEVHEKVLTFLKGEPDAIQREFKNPPPIHRDIASLSDAPNYDERDTPQP